MMGRLQTHPSAPLVRITRPPLWWKLVPSGQGCGRGRRRTTSFTAGPEMINFPQLKVGDKVNATVVLEQMVYLREPGAPNTDGGAGVIATAPAGSKPGMLVADSVEVTAVVKGIDPVLQTATLEFADGSRKTVKVRPDVQLKTEHLNRQVVIRLSSALVIRAQAQ